MVRRTRRGFTLIELMIVVTILGVLAAVAIPTFLVFIRRSKASEASANLNNLFRTASAFYRRDRTDKGILGSTATSCVVGPTAMTPGSPSDDKQKFTVTENFRELGFTIADYVYYGYGIESIGDAGAITCLNGAARASAIYTFFAHGDLDGDSKWSTFELAVASDEDDELYHARGFYIFREVE